MDPAIASDLSYFVLQERRRRGELTPPQADERRELTQRPVVRFWDAGEGQIALDSSDAAVPNPPRIALGE